MERKYIHHRDDKSIKIYDTGEIYNISKSAYINQRFNNNNLQISLRGKDYRVSLLVLSHFNPSDDEKLTCIGFKDGDKKNCHIDNLFWCKNGWECNTRKKYEPPENDGKYKILDIAPDIAIFEDGRIFSSHKGTFLKPCIQNDYYTLNITYNGKKKRTTLVSILVAKAFCKNDDLKNKTQVDHKDRNKLNNHASNLEWVTPKENIKRRIFTLKNKKQTKLTDIEKQKFIKSSREIPDLPDYFITKDGKILSSRKNIIRKETIHTNGYIYYQINKKSYVAHRLVYKTYIGKIKKGYVIDHINGNKTDNRLDNLEMVTSKENTKRWAERTKKCHKSVIQLDIEGNVIEKFQSIKEASEKTGVGRIHIGSVCNGNRITTGGYRWKFN
jgi:hypothetical protein